MKTMFTVKYDVFGSRYAASERKAFTSFEKANEFAKKILDNAFDVQIIWTDDRGTEHIYDVY